MFIVINRKKDLSRALLKAYFCPNRETLLYVSPFISKCNFNIP